MSEDVGTIDKEYTTLIKELDELEVKHAEALRQMALVDGTGGSVISIYENIERKCLRYLKHWPDMDWPDMDWDDVLSSTTFYPIVERLLTLFQKTFHAYHEREMRHMRGSNLNGFVWSPKHHISSFNSKLVPMLIRFEYDDMIFDEVKQIYKKTGGIEPSTFPTSCNLAELKTYATTKAAFKMLNEYNQEVVGLNQRLTKLYG